MNIIKLGGSIVNPDGKYDIRAIDSLIRLIKKSPEKGFIFVVGGGRICRNIQSASRPMLEDALALPESVAKACDRIGVAITHINADYVLARFRKAFESKVYPEILLDPTCRPKSTCLIYFAGGWKPGCSTDKDMMLLAKTFNAKKVFKITDFERVKKISPQKLACIKDDKKRKQALIDAPEIKEMRWGQLVQLVDSKWDPGLNTPFDPQAANIGFQMRKNLALYMGKQEQLPKMLAGKDFVGTIVKG